jgi:hypothetical protein
MICPDFISLVKELNFAGGFDENPYKHLQDFKEICATHMICPDFISLVKELNFAGGFDENPYKHLQDFKEICATHMISGMNHETLKWNTFLFSFTGWPKQWYKSAVVTTVGLF